MMGTPTSSSLQDEEVAGGHEGVSSSRCTVGQAAAGSLQAGNKTLAARSLYED